MRVFNVRLGHACNSSSTHSIVMLGDRKGRDETSSEGVGCYSHSDFQLWSKQRKLEYLGWLLQHSGRGMGMLTSEVSALGESLGVDTGATEYIDHQSVFHLPAGWNGKSFNPKFLQEMADFIARDEVAILGGNDNQPSRWDSLADHLVFAECDRGGKHDGSRVREDTDGTRRWWTVFDPETGNKIRFTFDAPLRSQQGEFEMPERSLTPELVDMKITGYCAFASDCGFCYMDSDTDGEHADTYRTRRVLESLAEMGVFEIALGGGEPTLHPDFLEIIQAGREAGLNMNFTSKNFAFFTLKKYAEWREGVAQNANAIAFSVNNRKDLGRFIKMMESEPFGERYSAETGPDLTVQCIPAVCSKGLMRELLKYANQNDVRLTALGFKRTGRGDGYTEKGNLRWLDLVEEMRDAGELSRWFLNGRLAVDTVMASDCQARFEVMGVDPVWYHTQEGAFSCYLDLTGEDPRLGASSFVPEAEMHQMRRWIDSEEISSTYRRMQASL